MTKKSRMVKTGNVDPRAIPGIGFNATAAPVVVKTTQPFEFAGSLVRDVAEAKAEAARVGFQRTPDGLNVRADLVASKCRHCGQVTWVKADLVAGDCHVCYHQPDSLCYQRSAMTKKELAAWKVRCDASRARWLAEGPARRAIVDAANRRRNEDDPATGSSFVNDPTRSVGRA
jgi:hypothetical protein